MVDYILHMSQERKCRITIIYEKENQITKRDIRVLEVSEESVKAFCYLRKQVRIFKRKHILSALPPKKSYQYTA